jgi:hypothetical protein
VKEYELRIFFRGQHAHAAVTLEGHRYPPVPLNEQEIGLIANVATRAACRPKEPPKS